MQPLSQAIEQYLEMCKYERNLSGYVRSVHQISQPKFCAAHHIVPDLLQSAYNVYTSGCREVLRDIVVLELLFSTGLRISELCALSKDTFLLNNGELRLLINGKGRKERILQITTPELLQVVQTQPKAAGCPAAFARTADNRVLSFT